MDVIYYYSLYLGLTDSYRRQLALQLKLLISDITDLPFLPESKSLCLSILLRYDMCSQTN